MVFFTCNHCGESVKKPSVEKHYNTRCRGAFKNVSCMDCQKDFRGEEYVGHIKCITEAEKYSGKGYVAKESKNTGAAKQAVWVDIVRAILVSPKYNLSPMLKKAFQSLQNFDNVPRKKQQFENFMKNCLRYPKQCAEATWQVMEQELLEFKKTTAAAAKKNQEASNALTLKEEVPETNEAAQPSDIGNGDQKHEVAAKPKGKRKSKKAVENGSENGNAKEKLSETESSEIVNGDQKHEVAAKPKGKRKSKTAAVEEVSEPKKQKIEVENGSEFGNAEEKLLETESAENAPDSDWLWTEALLMVVTKHPDGIPVNKLKKKLCKKYMKQLSVESLSEKQECKFNKKFAKKLKRSDLVQVQDEVVKLC